MSKFEKFINSVGDVCEKAVKETAKLTDVAATKVKIKAEEARLGDKYETLGRLSEEMLRDMDVIPEQIAAALDEITKAKGKITDLEAELASKKEKSTDDAENSEEENDVKEDSEKNDEE